MTKRKLGITLTQKRTWVIIAIIILNSLSLKINAQTGCLGLSGPTSFSMCSTEQKNLIYKLTGVVPGRKIPASSANLINSTDYDIVNVISDRDAFGYYYVGVTFKDFFNIPSQPFLTAVGFYDNAIIKLDSNDNVIWVHSINANELASSTQNQNIRDLKVNDAGDVFVSLDYNGVTGNIKFDNTVIETVCSNNKARFLVKINSNGTLAWSKKHHTQCSSSTVDILSIAPKRNSSDVYVALSFADSLRFGTTIIPSTGSNKQIILRYDNLGALVSSTDWIIPSFSLRDLEWYNNNLFFTGSYNTGATLNSFLFPAGGGSYVAKMSEAYTVSFVTQQTITSGLSFDKLFVFNNLIHLTGSYSANFTFTGSSLTLTYTAGSSHKFFSKYNISTGSFINGASLSVPIKHLTGDNDGNTYIVCESNSSVGFYYRYGIKVTGLNTTVGSPIVMKVTNDTTFSWAGKFGTREINQIFYRSCKGFKAYQINFGSTLTDHYGTVASYPFTTTYRLLGTHLTGKSGYTITPTTYISGGPVQVQDSTFFNLNFPASSITYTLKTSQETYTTNTIINVAVVPNLQTVASSTIYTPCQHSAISLNATNGGVYSWAPSTGLSATNIPNPIAQISGTSVIIYTVTTTNGLCVSKDTVKITPKPAPVFDIGYDTQSNCGQYVLLAAEKNFFLPAQTYSWIPSSAIIGSPTSTIVRANSALSNSFVCEATYTATGCKHRDTVYISPTSVQVANSNQNITTCPNQSVQISFQANGMAYLPDSIIAYNYYVDNRVKRPTGFCKDKRNFVYSTINVQTHNVSSIYYYDFVLERRKPFTASSSYLVYGSSTSTSAIQYAGDVCADDSSFAYVTGYLTGSGTIGTQPYSVSNQEPFVARVDSLGNVLWVKVISETSSTGYGNKVAFNPVDRTIICTGYFAGNITLAPSVTWVNPTSSSTYKNCYYIAAYRTNGTLKWYKIMYGSDDVTNLSVLNYKTAEIKDIAVGNDGKIVIAGYYTGAVSILPSSTAYGFTSSPVTNQQAYVLKLDTNGTPVWQYEAGSGVFYWHKYDQALTVDIDNLNNIYVGGYFTNTTNFGNSIIKTANDTLGDLFVMKMSSSGVPKWVVQAGHSTSANTNEFFNRIKLNDAKNQLMISGYYSKGAYLGSYKKEYYSGLDFFGLMDTAGVANYFFEDIGTTQGNGEIVSYLDFGGKEIIGLGVFSTAASNSICNVGMKTYNHGNNWRAFYARFKPQSTINWTPTQGLNDPTVMNPIATPTSNTCYSASIGGACSGSGTSLFCINVGTINLVVNSNSVICSSNSANLIASGASSYTWSPSNSINNPNLSNVIATPSITTIYTVSSGVGSCITSKTVQVVVNPSPTVNTSSSASVICSGSAVTLTASGAPTFSWQPGNLSGSTQLLNPSTTTIYSVTGISSLGCSTTVTTSIIVNPTPTISVNSNTNVICAGNNVNLLASGATTYSWQPGNLSGPNHTLVPLSNIIYTVVGSYTTGCADTKTLSIVVNQNPTVNVVPSSTFICLGNTSTLTANGANSYSWNTGPTTSSITVSPAINTIYTVIGTNTNNCSSTKTISIAVNANTVIITATTSNSILCSGNQATLTAIGATSYSWSGGPTTQNYIVTPSASTNYTVTGFDASNCNNTTTISIGVTSNTIVLSVNSSSNNSCSGSSATLTATGANTYSWSNGGNAAATIVTPTSPASYTVTGYDLANCYSSQTISINVYPLPIINTSTTNSLLCIGQSATISASGANNYTWSPGGIGVSIVVSPTTNTTYTVLGIDANGCQNTTSFTQNVSTCTDINNLNPFGNGIHIYPNPTNGILIIELNNVSENSSVEIYNSIGQLILIEKIMTSQQVFNLNHLTNGIYFIRVQNEIEILNKKIIKQ